MPERSPAIALTDKITDAIAKRAAGQFPPNEKQRVFVERVSALMRKDARAALTNGGSEADAVSAIRDWTIPPPSNRKLTEAEKMHRRFEKLSAADQAEFKKALGL